MIGKAGPSTNVGQVRERCCNNNKHKRGAKCAVHLKPSNPLMQCVCVCVCIAVTFIIFSLTSDTFFFFISFHREKFLILFSLGSFWGGDCVTGTSAAHSSLPIDVCVSMLFIINRSSSISQCGRSTYFLSLSRLASLWSGNTRPYTRRLHAESRSCELRWRVGIRDHPTCSLSLILSRPAHTRTRPSPFRSVGYEMMRQGREMVRRWIESRNATSNHHGTTAGHACPVLLLLLLVLPVFLVVQHSLFLSIRKVGRDINHLNNSSQRKRS